MTLDMGLELLHLSSLLTIMYTIVSNQDPEELSINKWHQGKKDLQLLVAIVVNMALEWLEAHNMRQEWEMQVMGVSEMCPLAQQLDQRPRLNLQLRLK